MNTKHERSCIDCTDTNCRRMNGSFPDFCPTIQTITKEDIDEVKAIYAEDENHRSMVAAATVEFEGYCRLTRIEEIIEYARMLPAKKLGIAACVGLMNEAQILAQILRHNGFKVYGIGCKVGCIPKAEIGIDLNNRSGNCNSENDGLCQSQSQGSGCIGFDPAASHQEHPDKSSRSAVLSGNTCNPVMQAKLLNEAGTDLNIVVGLCVGHDSLFYKYSDALVTTAVTKDRVLGHNPVAALYNADSYYKDKLFCEGKG